MKLTYIPRSPLPKDGLSALASVVLTPPNQAFLDQAAASCAGTFVFQNRKRAEARDLLAMAQISSRLQVQFLDLTEAFRALVVMQVPVPCLPAPGGELIIASEAVLGLTYPQEALRQQLPGYAFLQVLAPDTVWHANVAPDHVRPLCLGTRLPAGIRVKELILMAYGALSMQTVQIDERDAAGVLNPAAALWWQRNTHRIPLSRSPFLGPWSEPRP
jgi:hypothetical protein